MKDRWFSLAERTIVLLFLAAALLPIAFIVGEAAATVAASPKAGLFSLPKGFGYYTLKVTWNSLALAGAVILLALGLGLPAALALSRAAIPLRRLWLFLLALPLAAPSLVTAIAVRELFDRSGPAAALARALGLAPLSPYGFAGLAVSQLFHALPYTILLVSAGLMTVPRDIEEQSYSLGAGRASTTARLLLPYILPHILAATTMTLLFSLGDLGAPLILGGGYKVFSLEMYVNFISNWGDKRVPALFGLWASLLFFALLLFVAELDKGLATRRSAGPVAAPDRRLRIRLPATAYVAFLSLGLVLPYLRVFAGRFKVPETHALQALELKPLGSSVLLAGLAAPLAIGIAIFVADWLKEKKRRILLPGLVLSPAIIPGVIFGFGYLEALKLVPRRDNTTVLQLFVLVVVLAVRSVPFIVIILQSAFNPSVVSHDESARSLGASRAASFFTVLLPRARPFLAVAAVVSVFATITELASTLVLYPPGWRTMAVYVAYYMEEGLFAKAVGMALLMLLIVEASVLAAGSLLKGNPVERQVFLSPFSMLTIDIPKNGQRRGDPVKNFALKFRKAPPRQRLAKGSRQADGSIPPRDELAAMELKLLGMQINPHFFFNTLNTIVHLIETDKDAAIATVGKLSSLFRYSLDASEVRSIPLAKEIEYLRSYLEIEKLRFGDALSFSLDLPLEVLDFPIPPFLIQPIVENAVRHGKDSEARAYVVVSARRAEDGGVVVRVTDYGSSRFDPSLLDGASGTGIRNVRRRLASLYGEDLAFTRNQPQGLAVEMRIYAEKEAER